MSEIKIYGDNGGTFLLDDVKNSVVLRGGKYYWRHDTKNLVHIKTNDGKIHIYRVNSPLLVTTYSGERARKSDCVKLRDNLWIRRNDSNLVNVDGEPTLKQWAVRINDVWFLKSDPRLVSTRSGAACLKEECIELDQNYYGYGVYEHVSALDSLLVVKIDSSYFYSADCREVFDNVRGKKVSYWIKPTDKGTYLKAFYGFRDVSNPQYNRYTFMQIPKSKVATSDDFDMYFHKDFIEEDINSILAVKKSENELAILEIKSKIDKNYDEAGPEENNPVSWNNNYKTEPGKQVLFGSNSAPFIPAKPRVYHSNLGGFKYAFGVELETSAGLLSAKEANKLNIVAVGDRSIGAAEYVTQILYGNDGVEHLEKICKAVGNECMVDNRCGTHIHVGNIPKTLTTTFNVNAVELTFNEYFAIGAIKLGCLIEEDLYKMLGPSRNPKNYHCSSIRRYKDINEDNWKYMLGMFLFGPREDQIRSNANMTRFEYGSVNYNKNSNLSPWCGGRYKWLNLVRAYTACSSPTIEFRIFPGTTNFEKVYNFLLISMCFTYVVDNKYKDIISGKLTLNSMLELALEKNPELYKKVSNFIDARVKKFNRTNIY